MHVLQKCFTEKLMGSVGKEAFLKFALLEDLLLIFALIISEFNDIHLQR